MLWDPLGKRNEWISHCNTAKDDPALDAVETQAEIEDAEQKEAG